MELREMGIGEKIRIKWKYYGWMDACMHVILRPFEQYFRHFMTTDGL